MTDAQIALKHADQFPYELAPGDNLTPPDWSHRAARGVMADLTDRRGIKWELHHVRLDDRKNMVAALAAIIRLAHSEANAELCQPCPPSTPPRQETSAGQGLA